MTCPLGMRLVWVPVVCEVESADVAICVGSATAGELRIVCHDLLRILRPTCCNETSAESEGGVFV